MAPPAQVSNRPMPPPNQRGPTGNQTNGTHTTAASKTGTAASNVASGPSAGPKTSGVCTATAARLQSASNAQQPYNRPQNQPQPQPQPQPQLQAQVQSRPAASTEPTRPPGDSTSTSTVPSNSTTTKPAACETGSEDSYDFGSEDDAFFANLDYAALDEGIRGPIHFEEGPTREETLPPVVQHTQPNAGQRNAAPAQQVAPVVAQQKSTSASVSSHAQNQNQNQQQRNQNQNVPPQAQGSTQSPASRGGFRFPPGMGSVSRILSFNAITFF